MRHRCERPAQFRLLVSVPGIAPIGALQILSERLLPGPEMNVRAIFGIFKTATPYDGKRLFPQIQLQTRMADA